MASSIREECYEDSLDEFSEMKDKIRMLELELELSKLKTNMMESTKIEPARKREFRLQDVVEILPMFNPSSPSGLTAEQWVKKIETLREVYSFDEKLMIMAVGRKLVGTASLWWETWFSKEASWDSFVGEFKKNFNVHITQAEICERLRNKTRNKQQQYVEYCLEMKLLAKDRIEEESLLRYIITGINNKELQSGLLARGAQNFEDLRQYVNWYASMEGMGTVSGGRNEGSSSTAADSSRGLKERGSQCFNCFAEGHIAVNCPKPRRKPQCSICNKIGHSATECYTKQKKVFHVTGSGEMPDGVKAERSITTDAQGMVSGQLVVGTEARDAKILVDTGAAVSLAKNICINKSIVNDDVISGINGSKIKILGKKSAQMKVKEGSFNIDLYVVPNGTMNVDVIAGRDFLKRNGIGQINIDTQGSDMIGYDQEMMNEVACVDVCEAVKDKRLNVGDVKETKIWEERINEIYETNYVLKPKPLEPLISYETTIRLKQDKTFKASPQRFSWFERNELDKIVEDYLKKGLIRESSSPYSSRVVLTKKKNGTMRMCVNYRQLNKLVEKNCYPMPVIEDQVMKLYDKRYFSTLDLKNGFYHVSLEEESKKYTSFVTESGQFEFNRLPFGFKNSPPEFAKYINKILQKLMKEGNVIVFIDDIMVATGTIQEHLKVLEELFQTLNDNHVQLQLKKCEFLKTEVEYLGYRVSYNRITPSEAHIESVKNYPMPTDKKTMQRFLGLVSYFRKFVRGFNGMAAPLYDLMKEGVDFNLDRTHIEAVEKLKSELCKQPVLAIYSPNKETQLHTDASSAGFGGILMQREANGYFHPVMYFSRKATAAESKLHSFELETLAIYYSLKRFRPYLFGIKFTAITDCNSLKQTLDKRDINTKIARWALYLEEYDFVPEHRGGDKMRHVDALSRNWVYMIDEENEDPRIGKIYVSQLKDKNVQKLKGMVEKGQKEGYEIRDSIVYRKERDGLQLVVPAGWVESVIDQFHGKMGHFGTDKVCELIRRSFYFAKMKERVQEHINNCVVCALYNPKPQIKEVELRSIPKATVPFDTVHIDHLGPIELTKNKNLHILVMVDAFTKFIKLYPTKTTNTNEVIKKMRDFSENYSVPRRLVSDRGTAFSSKQFKKFIDELGIKHLQVAVACPKANGQVERYNRTIVPLLSKLCYEMDVEWDKAVKRAEYMLNNTVNQAIKETPAVALFGVKQIENNRGIEPLIQELCGNQEDMTREERWESMNENIKNQQRYNEKYYNKNVRKTKVTLKEGDLVLIRSRKIPGEANKLMKKFRGPYQVSKVLDMDRYVVEDVPNFQVSNRPFSGVYDISNLRKYPENESVDDMNEDDVEDWDGFESDRDISVWFEDWDPDRDSTICFEEARYECELSGDEEVDQPLQTLS